MDLQHLNLKIFAEKSAENIPLDTYIPIFHSWIQSQGARVAPSIGKAAGASPSTPYRAGFAIEEMLIDVADYAHVPQGSGVMLIGHHANLSMDETEGRLGFLYNRKVKEEGSNEEKIKTLFKWAFNHAKRLQEESSLDEKLKFTAHSFQLIVNDRLLAANNEENGKILESELKKLIQELYGKAPVKIIRHADPRERLILDVNIDGNFSLEDILQKL